MKRLSSMILTFILCISLCACAGDNVSDTAESSEDAASSLNTGDADNRNENSVSEDDDSITIPQMLASEYLNAILGVSDEWGDGTYLVYGTDKSGSASYGILYETGNFEPLIGYETYYPLANGNLFVTDEENFIKEFDYSQCDSNIECLGANGKIIDRGGNILYEPGANEPYQKMYIINSNRIFVLAASSNFDGIEVYWGVLDSNGNWVRELDSSGILVEAIKENNLIRMNADGSWSYTAVKETVSGYTSDGKFAYDHRVMNVSNGGAYNGRENQSLVFYLQTAFEKGISTSYNTIYGQLIIYRSDDYSFTAIDPNQYNMSFSKLTQIKDTEWIQWKATYSSTTETSYSYYLVDLNDGTCETIDNYLLTLRGVKYWRYSDTLCSDSVNAQPRIP